VKFYKMILILNHIDRFHHFAGARHSRAFGLSIYLRACRRVSSFIYLFLRVLKINICPIGGKALRAWMAMLRSPYNVMWGRGPRLCLRSPGGRLSPPP